MDAVKEGKVTAATWQQGQERKAPEQLDTTLGFRFDQFSFFTPMASKCYWNDPK